MRHSPPYQTMAATSKPTKPVKADPNQRIADALAKVRRSHIAPRAVRESLGSVDLEDVRLVREIVAAARRAVRDAVAQEIAQRLQRLAARLLVDVAEREGGGRFK
jgi:hypothetical protein